MFRAVGFDVGDTLLYYANTPLDWSSHYSGALSAVASACRMAPDPQQLAAGRDILRHYNTRVRPRVDEVTAEEVFSRILSAWSLPIDYLDVAVDAFFVFFQQGMCAFPETLSVLRTLRASGLRIGALTDVPYGMPPRFVERDLERAHLAELLETVVTSAMVGRRKPAPDGFVALAASVGVASHQMLYVGNEPKDIIGAKRAGVPAALIDRSGGAPEHGQSYTVSSLTALLEICTPRSNQAMERTADRPTPRF
jgi:putative hydrolase of the HAD superfamily